MDDLVFDQEPEYKIIKADYHFSDNPEESATEYARYVADKDGYGADDEEYLKNIMLTFFRVAHKRKIRIRVLIENFGSLPIKVYVKERL